MLLKIQVAFSLKSLRIMVGGSLMDSLKYGYFIPLQGNSNVLEFYSLIALYIYFISI